jgi:predicted anti-sigma-YlaC factor YlaD
MKCRIVQKKLSAYQDRELEPREQEQVTSHLLSCRTCREQYEKLERVWQTLGELQEIHPVPGFYRQLGARINEPRERSLLPDFQRFFQLLPSPAIATILLVIGILAGAYLGNILARSGSYAFRYSQASYSEEMMDIISLRAFDPIPTGTLGDGYLRMVSYTGEISR